MFCKGRFFSQCSQRNIRIHYIGFDSLGEMGLLHELPIAQGKRLSSRDMRAAEESRQAAFSVFVECLALHLLAKGAGLTAIAPCANTRECVSSGFSGIFGNDKHFFLEKSAEMPHIGTE